MRWRELNLPWCEVVDDSTLWKCGEKSGQDLPNRLEEEMTIKYHLGYQTHLKLVFPTSPHHMTNGLSIKERPSLLLDCTEEILRIAFQNHQTGRRSRRQVTTAPAIHYNIITMVTGGVPPTLYVL